MVPSCPFPQGTSGKDLAKPLFHTFSGPVEMEPARGQVHGAGVDLHPPVEGVEEGFVQIAGLQLLPGRFLHRIADEYR